MLISKSKYVIVSSPQQGYFAALTDDLLQEIFFFVQDDLTYARICQVNRKWYAASQIAWKKFCRARLYLEDEAFWIERGKDWKWLLQSHERVFQFDDFREGVGSYKDPSGWHYRGEWKLGKREGYGIVELKDQEKTRYKGHWANDKRYQFILWLF